MPRLILFRHGKSDWGDPALEDRERPLKRRGQRAARAMGRFLAATGQVPEQALASPARRARDTLTLAAEAGGWSCPVEVVEALYTFDGQDLFDFLQALDRPVESLLLTGHQPALGGLIERLSGAQVRFPTAAMACLDLAISDWRQAAPGCGELRWLLPPKLVMKAPQAVEKQRLSTTR